VVVEPSACCRDPGIGNVPVSPRAGEQSHDSAVIFGFGLLNEVSDYERVKDLADRHWVIAAEDFVNRRCYSLDLGFGAPSSFY
jgi:hypothetical protein